MRSSCWLLIICLEIWDLCHLVFIITLSKIRCATESRPLGCLRGIEITHVVDAVHSASTNFNNVIIFVSISFLWWTDYCHPSIWRIIIACRLWFFCFHLYEFGNTENKLILKIISENDIFGPLISGFLYPWMKAFASIQPSPQVYLLQVTLMLHVSPRMGINSTIILFILHVLVLLPSQKTSYCNTCIIKTPFSNYNSMISLVSRGC